MMIDLSLFLVFSTVIVLGFCLAFIGLSETAQPIGGPHPGLPATKVTDDDKDGEPDIALVWRPFWAMFADFELDELGTIPFGLPLMWVYALIANVLLVNMLVAMFVETYSRIKNNAEIEYIYERSLHIFEFQHVVHTLPPPLNVPSLLWSLACPCIAAGSGEADRARHAHMEFPTGEDEELPPPPPGVSTLQGGAPLSRKFTMRYLKSRAELTAQTSQASLISQVGGLLGAMEERVVQQLDLSRRLVAHPGAGAGRSFAPAPSARGVARGGGGGGGGRRGQEPEALQASNLMLGKILDDIDSKTERQPERISAPSGSRKPIGADRAASSRPLPPRALKPSASAGAPPRPVAQSAAPAAAGATPARHGTPPRKGPPARAKSSGSAGGAKL